MLERVLTLSLIALLSGTVHAAKSAPLKGFEKENWTATDCRLSIEDMALIKSIAEKSPESRELRVLPGSMTRPKVRVDRPSAVARAERAKGEARMALQKAENEIASLTIEQLIVKAQANPRFASCILTFKSEEALEYFERANPHVARAKRNRKEQNSMPLIDALGLKNVVMYSKEDKREAIFWEPTPEQLFEEGGGYWVGSSATRILNAVLDYTTSKMREAAAFEEDLQLRSGEVREDGRVTGYYVSSTIVQMPVLKKRPSELVPEADKKNMLFDDQSLDVAEIESESSSGANHRHGSATFEVGTTAREQALKTHLSACMNGFVAKKDGGPVAVQIVKHFNTSSCSVSGDQSLFLIPTEIQFLPKMNWSEVNKTNMRLQKPGEQGSFPRVLGHPNTGIVTKEFLRLAGHSTDADVLVSGRLYVTSRADYKAALKRTGIDKTADKMRAQLSEVLAKQARPSGIFHTTSKKDLAERKADEVRMKKLFADGAAELILSMMTGKFDEVHVGLTHKPNSTTWTPVQVRSTLSMVDQAMQMASVQIPAEKKQEFETAVQRLGGCAAQSEMFQKLIQVAIEPLEKQFSAKGLTHATATQLVGRFEKIVTRMASAMTEGCRAVAAKPMLDRVAHAKQALPRMKLPRR